MEFIILSGNGWKSRKNRKRMRGAECLEYERCRGEENVCTYVCRYSNKMNMRFIQWKIHLKRGGWLDQTQLACLDGKEERGKKSTHFEKCLGRGFDFLVRSLKLILSLEEVTLTVRDPSSFVYCLNFLFQSLLMFVPFIHFEQSMCTRVTCWTLGLFHHRRCVTEIFILRRRSAG